MGYLIENKNVRSNLNDLLKSCNVYSFQRFSGQKKLLRCIDVLQYSYLHGAFVYTHFTDQQNYKANNDRFVTSVDNFKRAVNTSKFARENIEVVKKIELLEKSIKNFLEKK